MYKQELIIDKDKKNKAESVLRLGNILGTALTRLEERLLQINVDYVKPDLSGDIKISSSGEKDDTNSTAVRTKCTRDRLEEFLISISKKNKKEDNFSYFTVVDGSKDEKIFFDKYSLAQYILYSVTNVEDTPFLGVYNFEIFTVELEEVDK
jgi:hypothetical protein|nr:MAG TPA: hypothetical protein [Caudoviricetes sp.]